MNRLPATPDHQPPGVSHNSRRWLGLLVLLLSGVAGFTQSRTPWQMLDRTNIYAFAATTLGDTNAYALAPVPAYNNPGWVPAPNINTIGFSRNSLSGVATCNGNKQSDACNFIYFQCFVYLPAYYRLTALTVSLTNVDDGARISLYNSTYTNGGVVPSSYVFDTGNANEPGWGTANLAPLFKVGETNRVVITLQDDCRGITAVSNNAFVFNGVQSLFPLCTNVTVTLDPAGLNCTTNVSVDNGSHTTTAGDTITLNQIPPPPYAVGTNLVTLWVTDNHGVSNSCTARVVVIDPFPPAISCPTDVIVTVANGCNATNVDLGAPAVSDNCTVASVTSSAPSFHLNPTAWWPGNGNMVDVIGGLNGSSTNGATFTNGMIAQAFNFGGASEVRIADNANLNIQTSLTLETWVFPTTLDGEFETILYKEDDSSQPAQYALSIRGPQTVITASCPGGAIAYGHFAFALAGVTGLPNDFCGWVDAGGVVPTNQWTHLAVSFDGATAKAYINGVLTRTVTGLSGSINVSSGPLKIGSRSLVQVSTIPKDPFNGRIDEVAIYNQALTDSQILGIYTAGSAGLCGTPTPPTVCAPLAAPNTFPVGTNIVTWTARDPSGNTNSCAQLVIVRDTQPPQITCPSNLTAVAPNSSCSANVTFALTATDNCGSATITSVPASGAAFPVGITIVTNTAVDASGNSNRCTFTVTVTENSPPTIICPANLVLATNPGKCTRSNVAFTVTAFDCSSVSITSTPTNRSTFPLGTTTVTNTATDFYGNKSVCTFTVTITDALPPTLNCPLGLTVASDVGTCSRSNVTFNVTANDTCDGPVAVTSVPPSGSTLPVGTTTVTSTATDSHGNTGICTFPVTVSYSTNGILEAGQVVLMGIDAEDGTVISSAHGPIITWQLLTSNILRQAVSGTGILAIGSGKSATDDVTRFWNALGVYNGQPVTHVNGSNIATVSFAGYRMIGISSDLLNTPSGGLTVAENNALATRAADIANFVNSGRALLGFSSVFTPSTVNAGPYAYMTAVGTVTLVNQDYSNIEATPAGSVLGINDTLDVSYWHQYFRTYPGFLRVLANVNGTTNPAALGGSVSVPVFTVTCPNAVTSVCPASLTLTGQVFNTACRTMTINWKVDGVTVQTNSLSALSPNGSAILTNFFLPGVHVITLTANDGFSTQSCTTAVNITGRPTITCPTNILLTTDPGKCSRSNVTFVVNATGVCGGNLTVVSSPASGSTFPVGTTTVTNIATENLAGAAGPAAAPIKITNICTFTVTVIDAEPPALACPPDIIMDANAGCFATNVNLGTPDAGDNCGVASVVNSLSVINLNPVAWWPGESNTFDVISGANATWAGFGNNNTYGVGSVGTAFAFDGTHRDRVNVGNPVALQLQNFTIEAWIKRSSIADVSLDDNFADGSSAGAGAYIFGYGCGGYAFVLFDGGALGLSKDCVNDTRVATPVTDLNWHHVAVTKSGTTVIFYVDGAQQPAPTPSTYSDVFQFTSSAAIGSRGDGLGNTFYGMVDDLAIYNQVLSAAQIHDIFAAGTAGKCGTPTPPTICTLPKSTNTLVGPLHNPANDHYYYLTQLPGTNSWTASEAFAQTLGGHLTTINDIAEQNWVYNTFSSYGGVPRGLWIGLNDAAQEGTFVWADGDPSAYRNWGAGEPNNGFGNYEEDYVLMLTPTDGRASKWNDFEDDGFGYVSNGVVEVAYVPTATFNLGTNFVTWTATDIHGNSNTCVQRIIVRDPLTPVINCPANLTLPTDPGQCSRSNVTFAVNFSGNCAGATLAQPEGLASGATFPKGVTTNRFVATDGSGNTNTCFFTVTVLDPEPPAITCPPNLQITANTDGGATNVTLGAAQAVDNCAVAGMSNDAPPFLPLGTNFVAWTATDTSDNSSACTQRVTVVRICVGDLSAGPIYNVTICASNPAVFTTLADSHDRINYLWKFNGQPLPGQTNNSLVLPDVGVPNAGTYTVEVSTDCGAPMISHSATLTVIPLPETNPVSYTNAAGIIINTYGAAAPYGSPLSLQCVPGLVKNLTVRLHDFTHRFPNDVNVVLASPDGRAVKLFGGAGAGISLFTGVDLLFSDATAVVPETTNALVSGVYHPSDFTPNVALPGPLPPTYATNLDTFSGADPNGVWRLYVYDSSPGDGGNIVSWSLNLAYLGRDDGLHLQNPRLFSNGLFSVEVLVQPGLTSVMQFSTDLIQWTPVATNVYSNYPGLFTHLPPQFPYRFYRAKLLP